MENEFNEPPFGEMVELIQKYEAMIKQRQQVFFEQEDYEEIIHFYEDNREFNKALQVLETALDQYSFTSFFHTKKAEILANQKRFAEALIVLEAAERLDPTNINIFLIRADIHLWEGKHEEAKAQVEYGMSIAEVDEDKCELFLEMADIYEDQEQFADLVDSLKSALRLDPENEEALNRFWFCTELLQKYEDSVQFHEELIERSPYSHLAWFNLGHAYAGLGMYEKSLEAFGYVIAINENFDAAYICSADVLYNMEQYDEALRFYLDAIKISKPNNDLYVKTGECYERLEDFSKACSYFRKAIAVDPYYDLAFFKLGEIYRQEEKWMKAISSYERAVRLSKGNIDYLTALAEAYMNVDEAEKALDAFEQIFQLDPETKQNWINLATAYFNFENFRKAFQVLGEAEQKFEGSADIFYIKSVFYLHIGNRHEALLNLERGLLTNFDEHIIIFEMDDSLLDNESVIQVIEQYRD